MAVRSPTFWQRAHLLKRLTKPMSRFGSWLRGCDCHDEERRARRAQGKPPVDCVWAGCRAKSLSSRVADQKAELLQLRTDLMQLADSDSRDAAGALSRMASLFALKTSWVHELHFGIWSLAGPDDAAAWLHRYNSLGPEVVSHRVAQRFGCVGGELRGPWSGGLSRRSHWNFCPTS